MPISSHDAKPPEDKLNNHSSLGQFLEKEKQGLLRHMANNVFCKPANLNTAPLPRGRRHDAFSKHTLTERKGGKAGEEMKYHNFKSQSPSIFFIVWKFGKCDKEVIENAHCTEICLCQHMQK